MQAIQIHNPTMSTSPKHLVEEEEVTDSASASDKASFQREELVKSLTSTAKTVASVALAMFSDKVDQILMDINREVGAGKKAQETVATAALSPLSEDFDPISIEKKEAKKNKRAVV